MIRVLATREKVHLLDADQRPEAPDVLRAAQLLQGLGLDLPNPLAGQAENLGYLFQGVLSLKADAKAHADHTLFAGRESFEHVGGTLANVSFENGIGW